MLYEHTGPTFRYTALALCCLALPAIYGQTKIDLAAQARNVDFSSAVTTKPAKVGTMLPSICATGEMFFKTDAEPGQNIYVCPSPNTWHLIGAPGSGFALPPNDGRTRILASDGQQLAWVELGGDVSGAPSGLKVVGLQGRSVSAVQPTDMDSLSWKLSSSQWGASRVVRKYNVSLTYDSAKGAWGTLPLSANNVVVFVAGTRWLPGLNYTINGQFVILNGADNRYLIKCPAGVVVDYDE